MGKPRKAIEKCVADYCRSLAADGDVYCEDHGTDMTKSLLVKVEPTLTWVQTCFVCSHETFHEMTEEDHDKLVTRYRLVCPKCKGRGVTLSRVDHLVSRAA